MLQLNDLGPRGKCVLVRVDYDVPIKDGVVQYDTRIQERRDSLRHLLEVGDSLVLHSRLGRARGVDPKYSLVPVAEALSRYLSGVRFVPHSPGSDQAHQAVEALAPGEVALLAHVRSQPGVEKNDPDLAARYAGPREAFVQDAFGSTNVAHARVAGVARHPPYFAGPLT
ncbi:phosphoglycerate kinase, partial [Thermus scotoductus]